MRWAGPGALTAQPLNPEQDFNLGFWARLLGGTGDVSQMPTYLWISEHLPKLSPNLPKTRDGSGEEMSLSSLSRPPITRMLEPPLPRYLLQSRSDYLKPLPSRVYINLLYLEEQHLQAVVSSLVTVSQLRAGNEEPRGNNSHSHICSPSELPTAPYLQLLMFTFQLLHEQDQAPASLTCASLSCAFPRLAPIGAQGNCLKSFSLSFWTWANFVSWQRWTSEHWVWHNEVKVRSGTLKTTAVISGAFVSAVQGDIHAEEMSVQL